MGIRMWSSEIWGQWLSGTFQVSWALVVGCPLLAVAAVKTGAVGIRAWLSLALGFAFGSAGSYFWWRSSVPQATLEADSGLSLGLSILEGVVLLAFSSVMFIAPFLVLRDRRS